MPSGNQRTFTLAVQTSFSVGSKMHIIAVCCSPVQKLGRPHKCPPGWAPDAPAGQRRGSMQGVLQSSSPACRGDILQLAHTAPPKRLVSKAASLRRLLITRHHVPQFVLRIIPSRRQIPQIRSPFHVCPNRNKFWTREVRREGQRARVSVCF